MSKFLLPLAFPRARKAREVGLPASRWLAVVPRAAKGGEDKRAVINNCITAAPRGIQ